MRNLFILILLFLVLKVNAQTPQVIPFIQASSMSKTVYNLFEDSSGRIWMGTDEGLYCWTGTELRHFINSNFPYEYSEIQEDEEGRIWCMNFSAQLFYLENDSLELFCSNREYISSAFSYTVNKFPDIYVSSDSGLLQFDFNSREIHFPFIKKEDSIQVNPTPDSLNNSFGITAFVGQGDNMFFVNGLKLFKLSENNELIEIAKNDQRNIFKAPSLKCSNKSIVLKNTYIEKKQVNSELSFYSISNSKELKTFRLKGIVHGILFDQSFGWYGTSNGIHILTAQQQQYNSQPILPNEIVSSIIKDREGVVWVSTTTNGVYRIPSLSILSMDGEDVYLEKDPIVSLLSTGEYGLFMFTSNGRVLRKEGSKLKQLTRTKFSTEGPYFNPFRKELGFSQTEFSYSLKKREIILNPYFRNVKSISFIKKGVALISTSGSARITIISAQDSINLRKLRLSKSPIYYSKLMDSYVKDIRRQRSNFNHYNSRDTSFYVGYTDGLYWYSNNQEYEIKWNERPILATDLIGLDEGGIICSTVSGDILQINYPNIELLARYDFRIKKILMHQDKLFVSSSNKVLKINLKLKTEEWITVSDGLPSSGINDIELHDDTVYVASPEGVAMFDADFSFKNKVRPLAFIKSIQVNFKITALKKNYKLSHKENNIEIHFGGIANRSNGSFNYQYRLLGFDTNWVNNSSVQSTVLFNALPPGEFQFQLKVINEDGVESDIETVRFLIEEPFYRKWWFYLLCIAIIVISVSTFFIIRISILTKQNALETQKQNTEKELARTQLMALRSQMNPHFIFNALNSIQDYIINNNKELASDYLGLFADLIRRYLYFSNQEQLTIDEEVESLRMYLDLEKIRFEDSFSCQVELDHQLDLEAKIPVMLVQPFVENAIKHGLLHKKRNRVLKVLFRKIPHGIEVEVYDNGIGRKASSQINKMRNKTYQPFATSAQQKRINLINKQNQYRITVQYEDLVDSQSISLGTRVVIQVIFI